MHNNQVYTFLNCVTNGSGTVYHANIFTNVFTRHIRTLTHSISSSSLPTVILNTVRFLQYCISFSFFFFVTIYLLLRTGNFYLTAQHHQSAKGKVLQKSQLNITFQNVKFRSLKHLQFCFDCVKKNNVLKEIKNYFQETVICIQQDRQRPQSFICMLYRQVNI